MATSWTVNGKRSRRIRLTHDDRDRGSPHPLARPKPHEIGRGSIKLGVVAERIAVLDVARTRCGRRERLSTARFLGCYGPEQSMPELRRLLAGDCPRLISPAYGEQCGAHFPQLVALFAEKG